MSSPRVRKRQKIQVEVIQPLDGHGSGGEEDTLETSSSFSSTRSIQPSSSRAVPSRNPTMQDSALQSAPIAAYTRTYAGASRSFLVEVPTITQDQPNSQEGDTDIRESYTDLRTRWGVDISEDDPHPTSPASSSPGKGKNKAVPTPLPSGMMNDLKSITELRSKGETRRFLDDVGYLFEGMDRKGGIGLRRASALEVVTKLCDLDFARKAKTADFLGRAWDVLREASAGDGDKILDIILAFFSSLVARDPVSLSELTMKPDFLPTLFTMLSSIGHGNDILALICAGASDAELKKVGVARTEKPLLISLGAIISKRSGLFPEEVQISARALISQVLATVPSSHLDPQHLQALLHTLRLELSLVPPRATAYITGLPLLPSHPSDIPSFEHIESCLRLLDSFLLGQWANDSKPLEADGLVDGLLSLAVVTGIMIDDSQYNERQKIAHKCTEITFRVLINLSHENPFWTQILLHHEFTLPLIMRTIMKSHSRSLIKKEEEVEDNYKLSPPEDDEDAQALDRVCLALGLLTNLIQGSSEAGSLIRETCIDPSCYSKRNCIRSCHCSNRKSALKCLVLVYEQQRKSSPTSVIDPGANFLRGHLAILFGFLMRENLTNQTLLLSVLPGTSNRAKLGSLVDQAREFVVFYADLTSKLAIAIATVAGEKKDGKMDNDPLSNPRHSIERIVRDGKGESVARGVVSFLESLRDAQPAHK